jgi:hypothetical protein
MLSAYDLAYIHMIDGEFAGTSDKARKLTLNDLR